MITIHFTYKQGVGELVGCTGMSWGYGFAGQGLGLNNPNAQDMHGVGPLPAHLYRINTLIREHPTMGLCVIALVPVNENGDPTIEGMLGRAGFYIHGAASLDTHGLAVFLKSSEGCICFKDCAARQAIWAAAPGGILQVVA